MPRSLPIDEHFVLCMLERRWDLARPHHIQRERESTDSGQPADDLAVSPLAPAWSVQ